MKLRVVLLVLELVLIPFTRCVAQQTPDPKQANLVAYAHFKVLTTVERDQLLVKAQSGDAEAQYWVGTMYTEGRVPQNLAEGTRWLLKSAEQGYARAELAYGFTSRLANPSLAERWMRRAAEHGDAEAQFWLGLGYEENWFGTVDMQEAIGWYRRAAEGGDPDAQVELGQKYEHGECVEQNYALAANWYRKAAEHVPDLGGAGQGKNHLGWLYLQGLGVPRDYVHAYFWFSLGGQKGNAADAREHLSGPEIRGAERFLSEWKERHALGPEVAAAIDVLAAASR